MKTKTNRPNKINFLDLSDSEKANFIKKTKENLRQRLEEAKFWRSLAQTDQLTINGQTIDFGNSNLQGFTC